MFETTNQLMINPYFHCDIYVFTAWMGHSLYNFQCCYMEPLSIAVRMDHFSATTRPIWKNKSCYTEQVVLHESYPSTYQK